MDGTVSIVVAIFNIKRYLNRCVRSIVDQTYKNLDIILVDDGSTDSCSRICDEWAKKDNRISVIHKDNGGLSSARNAGLKKAVGDYVCFVDGDDFIEKGMIFSTYKEAINNNADVVIYSNYVVNGGKKKKTVFTSSKKIYSESEIMSLLFNECIGTLPEQKSDYNIGFSPWGRLCKTALLIDNNIWFKSERIFIYEDLMFLLDLMPVTKKAVVLNEPLYNYCENADSLTRKSDPTRFRRLKKQYSYLKNNSDYHKEIFSDYSSKIRFKRTMLGYIRNAMSRIDDKSYYSDIKAISNDSLSKEILNGYPINKLPIKQRLFAYCLKYRLYLLLIIMIKLNNRQKS